MVKVSADIPADLAAQMGRLLREGWYSSNEAIVEEALHRFVEGKTFLGDSPRTLLHFASDALNESKPETAVKFADRALALLAGRENHDLGLYQSLIELRVQSLVVLGKTSEAVDALEEAREILPNNPGIASWIERLQVRGSP